MLELDQNKFMTDYVTTWLAHYDAERHLYGAAGPADAAPILAAITQARPAWGSLLQYGVVAYWRGPARTWGDR